MKFEITTEASMVESNGWVDSGAYYKASFKGNNPKGVKGCPMGRSQVDVESAIRDLIIRVGNESAIYLSKEDLVVVRHDNYLATGGAA
jgi:hypothetical protein